MTGIPNAVAAALAERYRIERELGAGGMATVYLAADLKHDRKVAIKVLKPELAAVLGAERFVQEIKTTAALSHPHILPLFDSGEAGGFLYYVMPYIQGETIRERLNRETQFGIDEAVRIATEVADALDYAHRHGVIHRDIKPENILLHDGRPMVMDFGIALAVSAAAGGRMTETGLSLGTPHYMSPEQATADKQITSRSDVYSLASVLYEMLAGEPPHMGNSAQAIIMKIIAEPVAEVTVHRKAVPAHVAAALSRALEKLPADRFDSAAAFASALGDPAFARAFAGTRASPPARLSLRSQARPFLLGAIVTAVLAAAFSAWRAPAPIAARPAVRAAWDLGEHQVLAVRLSPDGASALLSARRTGGGPILLRRTDDTTYARVEADGLHPWLRNVTFSPDGRELAYLDTLGRLLRVPVSGGAPVQVARLDPVREVGEVAWGGEGIIVVAQGGRLWRVPASGGRLEPVPQVPDAGDLGNPRFLPDGRRLLATRRAVGDSGRTGSDERELVVVSSDGRVTPVGARGQYGVVTQSGILVVVDEPDVWAYRFDLRAGHVVGEPRRIASDASITTVGPPIVDVARNGTVVWLNESLQTEIVLTDRNGAATRLPLARGGNTHPRFSPDGGRMAFARGAMGLSSVLWLWDLRSGVATRLTADSIYGSPEWNSDAASIVFGGRSSSAAGRPPTEIFRLRLGGGSPEALTPTDRGRIRPQPLPGGRSLLYETPTSTPGDIWRVVADSPSTARPVATGPSDERNFAVSRDGKWLAFTSDRTGTPTVFLRRLDTDDEIWFQVAPDGGEYPRWVGASRGLLYLRGDSVMRVEVTDADPPSISAPRALFARPAGRAAPWDVSPDGQRFAFVVPTPGSSRVRLNLLLDALAPESWEKQP